ncbi:hypothetical protein NDN08_003083 [Rhodosorus marinus]|uniref:Cytochrome b5 heme-binding domain-containing protein n=1 Tax=Rhodosorus marinus TaxID=101924 RepID=A0AAV8UVH6_9RHOD|nr:hypothetical protein NDN08_003083 [Rhodosorus marinus]
MKVSSARAGKVPLKPGFSQLDWLRKKSTKIPPRPRNILLEELREHSSVGNAWTAVRGKVYDISHYLDYHPGGGPYLMMAAGKDATALFDKYHSWVNIEFMLDRMVIGTLVGNHT